MRRSGRRAPGIVVLVVAGLLALAAAPAAPAVLGTPVARTALRAAPPPPLQAPVTATGWAPAPPAGTGAAEWASDSTFHPTLTALDVTAVAVAPDGDLVLGGSFYENGTTLPYSVVRLHADGSEETSFAHFHSGEPFAVAVQPSGDVLVAADLATDTVDGRRGLVRLDETGAVDPTFPDLAVDGPIRVVRQLDDGRLLIGGNFTTVGGVARQGVAIVSADGVVDPAFVDPEIAGGVGSLGVDPDGSIVVAGSFTQVGGVAQVGLARLDDQGARLGTLVAPTLDGMAPRIEQVTVLPDGRLAVGGRFTAVNGVARKGFVVLSSTGAVDEGVADLAFAGDHSITAMYVDAAGRLVLVGFFHPVRGEERRNIVRLLPDGTVDPSFVDPQVGPIKAVAEESDGALVIGGAFQTIEGRSTPRVARLLADGTPRPGSLDRTFGDDGIALANVDPSEYALDVAVQADGAIVTAGTASGLGGRVSVMRFDSTGEPDVGFGGDGAVQTNLTPRDDFGHSVAVQSDGRIVVAGHAGGASGPMAVVRYLADGRLDPSFSRDGKVTIDFGYGAEIAYDVVVLPNGKIVVGGAIDGRGGRIGLARLRTDGSLDPAFGTGGKVATNVTGHQDFAWSLVAGAGGRIVAAGVADTGLNGTPLAVAVRYLRDGRLDVAFDGDGKRTWRFSTGALGAATALAYDAEDHLVVAGYDSRSGGRMAVARLRDDGSTEADALVDLGDLEDSPWDVLVDPAGRVVMAGYGGGGQVAVVRLTPTLALDPTFDDDGWLTTDVSVGGLDVAFGAALDPDGRLVIAGGSGVTVPQVLVARYLGD